MLRASVADELRASVAMHMSRLYDLQKFCRDQRDWLIAVTESLVRLESPTTDKAAVDRCGRELASQMTAIGGRVTRLTSADRGDHLRAEFGVASTGDASPRRPTLLLGHFDTVWPVGQLAQMPLLRTGGRLHGPGVFDMKAGIAIGLLGAFATTRVLQSLLFGVSPTDPVTLGGVTIVLVMLGALAAYAPARRATKVDPVEVLRRQ